MNARQRVFNSIFPPASSIPAPTPQATPVLDSGLFEQQAPDLRTRSKEQNALAGVPSKGRNSNAQSQTFDGRKPSSDSQRPTSNAKDRFSHEDRAIRHDRAWHEATTFLALPQRAIDASTAQERLHLQQAPKSLMSFVESIDHLTSDESSSLHHGHLHQSPDLADWYQQEIALHYARYQQPLIQNILSQKKSTSRLHDLVHVAATARSVYFAPLTNEIILHQLHPQARERFDLLRQSVSHMLASALRSAGVLSLLKTDLRRQCAALLGLEPEARGSNEFRADTSKPLSPDVVSNPAEEISRSLHSFTSVGLARMDMQRVLAEVISELMTSYVYRNCARKWYESPSSIPAQLSTWAETQLSDLVTGLLSGLYGNSDSRTTCQPTPEDLHNWKQRLTCELGHLRLQELLDIILSWDAGSQGGIEDLKQYTTTTAARAHIVHDFTTALHARLLHPGASTTEILQVYISIIRAFTVLDPRGVLLEGVARPIRRYLRDRDDTVRIIVGGLLADPHDEDPGTDILHNLAAELDGYTSRSVEAEEADLDWDDPDWLPNPVDAGPGFRHSKGSDIVGSLISLFETKDIFVKEFQNTLGERLLRNTGDLSTELRVLNLLKLRFGEAPLQACEVMLNDVVESRRTNTWIQRQKGWSDHQARLNAKILSRLFWPSLRSETFRIPTSVQRQQDAYSAAFERYKSNRKLTWLNASGQVRVELQFPDRTIDEEVQTWQASVIYAFQSNDNASGAQSKTAAQLADELEMDDDLVANALTFWVGKLVLRHSVAADTYSVLETLTSHPGAENKSSAPGQDPSDAVSADIATAAATASAAATAAGSSALRSAEDVAESKMALFWQFIQGMLTNQGAMPLPQIVMMLKFAVPEGFPYSADELRAFLGRRVDEGVLEVVSGSYKMVKK